MPDNSKIFFLVWLYHIFKDFLTVSQAFRQGSNQYITPRNDFVHFETKKTIPRDYFAQNRIKIDPPVLLGISQ